jgi:hypothetical protein
MTPRRHNDPPDSEESNKRAPVDLTDLKHRRVIVDVSLIGLLLYITFVVTKSYVEFRDNYITVDDAVAIHKAVIAVVPEPIRSTLLQVNIRDIKAENKRRD